MPTKRTPGLVAFVGPERLAAGTPPTVAAAAKRRLDADPGSVILIFDRETGRQLDLDLRGTLDEVTARLPRGQTPGGVSGVPRGRGRPKLGVVSKEVTLLPRHWAWLSAQRGSASAVLRRLVDDARRAGEKREAVRQAQDAAYRFMTSMAGNAPGYEAAIRALYRSARREFAAAVESWPPDVRAQCTSMAAEAFEGA
jgi:hypothetical protein